jgi:hypothetical protein
VNIREYYNDAEGNARPGKKGIMLTADQVGRIFGLSASELTKTIAIVEGAQGERGCYRPSAPSREQEVAMDITPPVASALSSPLFCYIDGATQ